MLYPNTFETDNMAYSTLGGNDGSKGRKADSG